MCEKGAAASPVTERTTGGREVAERVGKERRLLSSPELGIHSTRVQLNVRLEALEQARRPFGRVVPLPALPQKDDVCAEPRDLECLPPPGPLRAIPRARQGIGQDAHGDPARPADRELRGRVAVKAVTVVPEGIESRLSERHQDSVPRRDAAGDSPVERLERVGKASRDVENLLGLEQAVKRRPPHGLAPFAPRGKVRAGGTRERSRFGAVISHAARRPGGMIRLPSSPARTDRAASAGPSPGRSPPGTRRRRTRA